MSRTRLELGSSGSIDLMDDVPYSLNYSIADIREPDKRSSNYSKTIKIPGSKNNNKIFKHIFEIDIDCVFNPNLKSKCTLYVDEIPVMVGYLQLLKVIRLQENKLEYEVVIKGNVGNVFTEWGDSYLSNLNLAAYNHTYNKTTQKASWTASVGTGYVYPMIDYGATNGLEYGVQNFYPAIYVKQYIDSAFALVGCTYESNFFNTNFFKRLIIPFSSNQLTLSASQMLSRYFKAGRSADYTVVTMNVIDGGGSFIMFSNENSDIFEKILLNTDISDTSNQFNTSTNTYTVASTGNYVLKSTISFKFSVSGLSVSDATINLPIKISAVISKISSLGFITNIVASRLYNEGGEIVLNNTDSSTYTFSFESPVLTLNAGDTFNVGIQVPAVQIEESATVALKILSTTTTFENRIINTGIFDGNTVEVNNTIPQNIKIKDFFMSIVKMFNLYVETDKSVANKYYIEPRNDFYANGTTIDWTDKLDISRDVEITPMGDLNASKYRFKYKSDKDYYNAKYENGYLETYGTYNKDVETDFIRATKDIDIIFSPTPLVKIGTTDRIISQIISTVESGVVTQIKNINIRILYFTLKNTTNSWTYKSLVSGDSTETQYPYAGHVDVPLTPTFDLNFGVPSEVYYDTSTYTNNTLFNAYYRQYIEEITNKDSKIVTGYFYLTPKDIHVLDFRNSFKVKNHLLRLNKIYDYSHIAETLTKCEFIRIKKGTVFTPQIGLNTDGNGIVFNTNEPVPIATILNASVFNNSNVIGDGNVIDNTVTNTIVNGNNNYVGSGSSNVNILASSGVTVLNNLTNISVINTNNVLITESNTGYINGVPYSLDGNSEQGITAYAGGGQTNAYQTTKKFNLIETCTTAGDSVKTLYATLDNEQHFKNVGAQSMNVYPQVGERFRRGSTLLAVDAPYPVASRNSLRLYCYETGIWTD